MNPNVLLSDQLRVVGVIDPDLNTAGAVSTGWISAADFDRFLALVLAGDLGTSGTLDAKIEEATDGTGTGAQDLPGKAITQLTQAGTDSNKQAIINVSQSDLTQGFTHFRLTMTIAVASSDSAGLVLGEGARYEPTADLSTVDEIV